MIKIKNYDKKNEKISFITDMSISLANAIRRSVLEIPIMAVDEVEIVQNDSALYDEVLAHRIGLIPIKTTKVSSKEIRFKLKEKGEKIVYSTDLKPSIGTGYKLPITLLGDGQEIQLTAIARIGTGNKHIKYSPGLIYYKHNVNEDVLSFVKIDAQGKVSYDEKELKERNLSEKQINKIKKLIKSEELLFTIESWGQIDVKDIFTQSIEVLEKNLNELNKAVK